MQATFLGADFPLVKSFKLVDGVIEKSPYPNAYLFTSESVDFTTLDEFKTAIVNAAARGQCLLKGEIKRPLSSESRAGSTDAEANTSWVCFDLDGVECFKSPNEFMTAIGLGDVSYIVQYSASAGITGSDGIRAHIFALLSSPVAAPFLKQWLIHLNLSIPGLRSEVKLNRVGLALRWPLDITCCQNDKLLYIAPATLGEGVKNSFKGPRIKLVKKGSPVIQTADIRVDINKNRAEAKAVLAELRKTAGYEVIRDRQYKVVSGETFLSKPGEAIITGIRQDRGFVYLNLNGGDSWGYFHPEDNPEYIRNFKGEPLYRTEELLPEYWKSLKNIPTNNVDDMPTRTYFVCRDFGTDRLYNGYYDADENEVVLARAANEGRLRGFMKQHGQPVPDFIPDWTLIYDPTNDLVFDPENKIVNTYRPSNFSKLPPRKVTECPPMIKKVIESAIGSGITFEHWMNWFAFIVQTGKQAKTAWALHGTQGTGKGILFHQVIKPILGASNCASIGMDSIEAPYNGWMHEKQFVFVDEVQLSKLLRNSQVNAKLKLYIVEPDVPIRRMYSEVFNALNFVNFMFASNTPDPVIIEVEDRRFSAGNYQTEKLVMTDAEIAQVVKEQADFYMYVKGYAVDENAARTPLDNEARRQLISINQTSVDVVAHALLSGDCEVLVDALPDSLDPIFATPIAAAYRNLLNSIISGGTEHKALSRDELFIVFEYCVGSMPRTPNKFTSLLKHHRLYVHRVRRDTQVFQGIHINWQQDNEWFNEMRARLVPKATAKIAHIKRAAV